MDGAAGGPMLVLVLAHSRRAPHPRRPWSPYRGLLRGLGTAILSTSRGVMTGKQAYYQHIGGEVLCYIW